MTKFNLALFVAMAVIAVSASAQPAAAAQYPWCANYSGDDGGGGTNCGFATLEQCKNTINGTGGYCSPNQFYQESTAGNQPRKPKRRNAN